MISNVKLKYFLQNKIFPVFSFINKRVMHDNRIIMLYSNMGFRDNVRALFDYLISEGFNENYHIVCSLNDYRKYNNLKLQNVDFVSNLKGIILFFKVGYVFYCFGKIPIIPGKKQRVGQMWHGIYFKGADAGLLKGHSIDKQYYTDFFSTSKYLDSLWCRIFSLKKDVIKITGQPRNDALFRKDVHYDFGNYSKLVVWLPTFRKSKIMGYDDTKDDSLVPLIPVDELESFNLYLKKKDVKIVIKLHPMQDLSSYNHINLDHLILLSHTEFTKRKMDLYPLMAQCDALITDYSSVFFDYLLVNRPIGFTIDDMSEYDDNRGFNFDNPLEYMPGPHMKNMEDLRMFVDNLIDNRDNYVLERRRINGIFNEFQDGCASARVLQTMGISL